MDVYYLKSFKTKNCFSYTYYLIQHLDDGEAIGTKQWLCLPKAKLNTTNSTIRWLCFRLVKFVVFEWIQLEKSVWTNAEKRITLIPTFLTTYGLIKLYAPAYCDSCFGINIPYFEIFIFLLWYYFFRGIFHIFQNFNL